MSLPEAVLFSPLLCLKQNGSCARNVEEEIQPCRGSEGEEGVKKAITSTREGVCIALPGWGLRGPSRNQVEDKKEGAGFISVKAMVKYDYISGGREEVQAESTKQKGRNAHFSSHWCQSHRL